MAYEGASHLGNNEFKIMFFFRVQQYYSDTSSIEKFKAGPASFDEVSCEEAGIKVMHQKKISRISHKVRRVLKLS